MKINKKNILIVVLIIYFIGSLFIIGDYLEYREGYRNLFLQKLIMVERSMHEFNRNIQNNNDDINHIQYNWQVLNFSLNYLDTELDKIYFKSNTIDKDDFGKLIDRLNNITFEIGSWREIDEMVNNDQLSDDMVTLFELYLSQDIQIEENKSDKLMHPLIMHFDQEAWEKLNQKLEKVENEIGID